MNHTPSEGRLQAEQESLIAQIVSWNEQLESAVNNATNRAFNLGCFVGLFPASALILLTYFLAGKSWVGAIVMLVLMALALVLFANAVAGITRQNTMKRFYQETIQPEIVQMLKRHPMDYSDFAALASESLASASGLLTALTIADDPPNPKTAEEQESSGK